MKPNLNRFRVIVIREEYEDEAEWQREFNRKPRERGREKSRCTISATPRGEPGKLIFPPQQTHTHTH